MTPLQRFDMRADPETERLLEAIVNKWGLSKSAAMRYAIRRTAEVDGLDGFAPDPKTLEHKPGRKPRPRAGGADG